MEEAQGVSSYARPSVLDLPHAYAGKSTMIGCRSKGRRNFERQTCTKRCCDGMSDRVDSQIRSNSHRSPKIGPSEAIGVGSAGGRLLLKLGSTDHHCDALCRVAIGCTSQTDDRRLSFGQSSFADEPPGGFGSKGDESDQERRQCPLQTKRDPVGPLQSNHHQHQELQPAPSLLTWVVPWLKPYRTPAQMKLPIHQQIWT